jgi:hypothetical protein
MKKYNYHIFKLNRSDPLSQPHCLLKCFNVQRLYDFGICHPMTVRLNRIDFFYRRRDASPGRNYFYNGCNCHFAIFYRLPRVANHPPGEP